MENIIVKVRCNGDIRRMAVEDNLTLEDLRNLLSKLYKVRNFKIFRDDLDLIPISDDTELYHILKMVRNSSTKVLRLALVEEPEEIAATPIERVLMRGDMRVKLEEAIVESVRTKPVMDAIIQKMMPQIIAAMEDPEEDISSIIIRNVEPSVIEESMSSSSASSCSEVSSSSSLDQSISPEDENSVPKDNVPQNEESSDDDEEEEFESRDEDEPMLDESKRDEEEAAVEEEPKREEIFEREVENREEEEEAEESEENREPVVSVETELSESQAASPFKAFMTLVKSIVSKKDSDNKVDIANLEEMLKQLNEMGFTDRESNLKLVKFHNQFKEGLDEVVEALLTQSQLDTVNNNEVRVSSH